MSVNIAAELEGLFVSVILGVFIGILYDFTRSLPVKKRIFTDLLFWILTVVFFSFFWLNFLSGELRWYMLIGIASSLLIYFLSFSKWVYKGFCFISVKICAFFKVIFKILLTVKRFLGKIVLVYVKNKK